MKETFFKEFSNQDLYFTKIHLNKVFFINTEGNIDGFIENKMKLIPLTLSNYLRKNQIKYSNPFHIADIYSILYEEIVKRFLKQTKITLNKQL